MTEENVIDKSEIANFRLIDWYGDYEKPMGGGENGTSVHLHTCLTTVVWIISLNAHCS